MRSDCRSSPAATRNWLSRWSRSCSSLGAATFQSSSAGSYRTRIGEASRKMGVKGIYTNAMKLDEVVASLAAVLQ